MTLGLCNALVAVFPWTEEYRREYADEKKRLQAICGLSDPGFEHIGSTAVPGMPAKPIIDIMMTVGNVYDQTRVADALARGGYTCLGECGRPGRLFLVRGVKPCIATHHVHLVLEGSAYQANHLTIRNALIADTVLAAEYGALKMRLALEYPMSRMFYRLHKGSYILEHILSGDKTIKIRRAPRRNGAKNAKKKI
jgi:GrpB-like predicted nucleotidyltransferase (UPF0157 family)